MLGDAASFELSISDRQVVIRFGLTGGQHMVPGGADYAAAVLCRSWSSSAAGWRKPLEVQLMRPQRPQVYRDHFGVMPVFGALALLLRFDEPALRSPLSSRDARVLRILEERAIASVDALRLEPDLLRRVRAHVRKSLDTLDAARGDIAHVAASCGMSERTLRRQLEAAGTSFRNVVDAVRRARALELIDKGHTRIGALAEATGYTDPTAFARAFRRWTGLAPLQYLERHRPGDLHRS